MFGGADDTLGLFGERVRLKLDQVERCAMQRSQRRAGRAQQPRGIVIRRAQQLRERRADHQRVEHDAVVGDIRLGLHREQAAILGREPIGHARDHAEGARALIAIIDLREHRRRRVIWLVVAQHMALAGPVADGRHLDLGAAAPCAGSPEHLASVGGVGSARELWEANVERRDLDAHPPGWNLGRQPAERA
jgi:hypothetical protein